jgi:hypothetical protein
VTTTRTAAIVATATGPMWTRSVPDEGQVAARGDDRPGGKPERAARRAVRCLREIVPRIIPRIGMQSDKAIDDGTR